MTSQPPIDETPLLTRIAQQDPAALSELYDRYARIIYAVAFKILGSVEEAEEVVVDVFCQVWRTAGAYNPQRGRVDGWLFMLTRSRAMDRLRRLQKTARAASASVEILLTRSPQMSSSPEEDLLISERRAQVLTALSQLPEEQREVLELAYYKGLTHVEIAAQTGKSLGTIKTRIRLGLKKLRTTLESI